jgi:Ca2+/Na+ antiporter
MFGVFLIIVISDFVQSHLMVYNVYLNISFIVFNILFTGTLLIVFYSLYVVYTYLICKKEYEEEIFNYRNIPTEDLKHRHKSILGYYKEDYYLLSQEKKKEVDEIHFVLIYRNYERQFRIIKTWVLPFIVLAYVSFYTGYHWA